MLERICWAPWYISVVTALRRNAKLEFKVILSYTVGSRSCHQKKDLSLIPKTHVGKENQLLKLFSELTPVYVHVHN